jgi:hypothetical protein
MLSLARCRELLGHDAPESDEALSLLRDELSALADAAIDQFSTSRYAQFAELISPDERDNLDERAAIGEYEGNLPRGLAERHAANLVIGHRKAR